MGAVVTVRELVAKLGFDLDTTNLLKFDEHIEKAKSGLEELSGYSEEAEATVKKALDGVKKALIGLTVVSAGATAGLIAMVVSAAHVGDEIGNTAPMLGLTVEEFQRYRYAANLASVSNEEFVGSTQILVRNIGDAIRGNTNMAISFRQVGISMGDLKRLTTGEILRKMSDGLAHIPSQSRRVSLEMDLLGRSGARMGEFLSKGTKEMDRVMAEVEAFGLFDKASAEQANQVGNSFIRLGSIFSGIKNEIAVGLFPIVKKIVDGVRGWILAHKDLIHSGIHTFVTTLSAVLEKTWTVVRRVAKAIDLAVMAMGGWRNTIKLFGVFFLATMLTIFGPLIILGKIVGMVGLAFLRLHTVVAAVSVGMAALLPIGHLLFLTFSLLAAYKFVGWLIMLNGGYIKLAANILRVVWATGLLIAEYLLTAAAIALVILAIEDIYVWLHGGKSIIGEWLGEWGKIPAKLKAIWKDIKQVFIDGGKFIEAVMTGDFKGAYKILDDAANHTAGALVGGLDLITGGRTDAFANGAPGGGGLLSPGYGIMPGNIGSGLYGSNFGQPNGGAAASAAGFKRAFQPAGGAAPVGGGGVAGPSVINHNKIDVAVTLPKDTPEGHAQKIADIVDSKIQEHVNHSLAHSVAPGD